MSSLRPVATGEVDLGAAGPTELRIHGVGGTSPQELLDHPHPVQVAGDATSGFYRRWDTDADGPDNSPHHVEGFCWGGMTSGSGRRALWVLLIPFLLVNVAHWALPGRAATRRWANTAAQRMIRLFALSLTMTLTLATAETGMDLVGRQCSAACFKSEPSWARTLLDHRFVVVVVGALIPVAVITLLGALGRSTWRINEKVPPHPAEPSEADDPALSDPQFWAGAEPVRRLRAVHLGAGLALAAVIQVLPVLDSRRRPLAVATLFLAGALIAVAGVTVVSDGVARPHHRPTTDRDKSRFAPWLMWAAVVVLALAVVVDLLPHAGASSPAGGHALARLDWLVQALLIAQTAMIVLLVLFAWGAGLQPSAVQAGRRRRSDGLIAAALAVLAWLAAWFFAAAAVVRVAEQLFGSAQGAVPTVYTIFSALVLPGGALVLLGVAAAVLVWYRREASRQRQGLATLPPPAGPDAGDQAADTETRIASVGGVRARAHLLDIAPQLVLAVSAACVVLAIVGLVVAKADRRVLAHPGVQQLAGVGTVVLGLGIVNLLAVARKMWKDAGTRRSIGILWDLGTFWPRAAHPLAPPCYSERALPQLQIRLASYGGAPGDGIVVAGHSQGSVIAAALILMPRAAAVVAPVTLVTYGCPLGRLYARAFPGYLGPQVLGVGQSALSADPAATTVLSRSGGWLNLYRDSDPIGGYVGAPPTEHGPVVSAFGGNGAVKFGATDIWLIDPAFAVPPGDIFPPRTAAHSHYREDSTYDTAVDALLAGAAADGAAAGGG